VFAKLLSWKVGGVAALAATAVWAAVPDSMLQNGVVDPLRAWGAHGRLTAVSDQQPLGERYPVVVVLGRNDAKDPDGPPEDELISVIRDQVLPDWEYSYRLWTDEEFVKAVKVYGFWYNSDAAPMRIGSWLRAKIEIDPELTQAGIRFSGAAHSMGGRVLFCYWVDTGNGKLDAKVTSATPFEGTPLADEAAAERACQAAFPILGRAMKQSIGKTLGIDFSAPGIQWMVPGHPAMTALLQSHPLDASWTLVGSKVEPIKGNAFARNVNVVLLLDRLFLEDGSDQDVLLYRLGALILEKAGVKGGSDGLVPLQSALCEHYAGNAQRIQLASDHNHAEMLRGNGGMELHDAMLKPVMPYILAHQQKALRNQGFDLWLPEMPTIRLPIAQTGDALRTARLVWTDEQGKTLIVASHWDNPQELQLPMGGTLAWPQWMGDDLIATWQHDAGTDIVLIQASDGRVVQLTNDGKSLLAAPNADGSLITLVDNGDLILRSAGGLAKVVVRGPLQLDSPPVFLGDKLYFAVKNSAGGADLRWVGLRAQGYRLSRTKLVERQVNHPMRIGSLLLAVRLGSEHTTLTVVTGRWGTLRAELTTGTKLLNTAASTGQVILPTQVDMDNQDGSVYLITGQDLRQLDLSGLLTSGSLAIDAVAPRHAGGIWLDAK